ncbi:hypothetical protein HYH03_011184 [Edaphochlamys debaryana]|uniref:Ankyrin repeat domain-containing protein n=1 Tax=Edaphochlamys debaryana TaxID=47281 RepID=A0A835XUB1_9CHLO|nr:hypothetical protein HYH03_011184 [Edaphochlamys debaryana]|eukprot:KAG2490383.1 hypothetical protein HYH03_011184 [Edaphochlamys debaryana]
MAGCTLETARRLVARLCDKSRLRQYPHADLTSPTGDWAVKTQYALDAGRQRLSQLSYTSIFCSKLPDSSIVERCTWLRRRGFRPGPGSLQLAIKAGHAGAVEWLLGQGVATGPPGSLAPQVRDAAASGHLEVLQALARAGYNLDSWDFARPAAQGGRLPVIVWAHESLPGFAAHLTDVSGEILFEAGAASGSVETMRWLHARGCHVGGCAWAAAVRSGCEAALELLGELGCPRLAHTHADVYDEVVQRGEWGMLPALHRLDLESSPGFLNQSIKRRAPLRWVQWLAESMTERGAHAPYVACAEAVQAGEWGMLPVLCRLGFKCGPDLLEQAVRAGTPLPWLQWLAESMTEQGVRVNWKKVAGAAAYSRGRSPQEQADVVQWLQRMQFPQQKERGEGLSHLLAAAAAGALHSCNHLTAQLRMKHENWTELLQCAGESGQQAVCEWLVALRSATLSAAVIWRAGVRAASNGHDSVAAWLIEAGNEFRAEAETDAEYDADDAPFDEFASSSSEDDYTRRDMEKDLCSAAMEGFTLETAMSLVARLCEKDRLRQYPHAALTSPTGDWEAKTQYALDAGRRRLSQLSYIHLMSSKLPVINILERCAWLRQRGFQPGPQALQCAVSAGHAGAVEWLLGQGVATGSPGSLAPQVRDAAASGHLEVLQALARAGCNLDSWDFARPAARGGRLPVIVWAHESLPGFAAHLTDVSGEILFEAGAASGSVETMRWLHARGCHAGGCAWAAAVRSGCEAALELLGELGCPRLAHTHADVYDEVVQRGEWGMLPALHRLDLESSPGFLNQSIKRRAPLHWVQWLAESMTERGVRVDWAKALEKAACARGRSDDEQWDLMQWVQRMQIERDGLCG